jgi:hypothetical protein
LMASLESFRSFLLTFFFKIFSTTSCFFVKALQPYSTIGLNQLVLKYNQTLPNASC